MNDFDVNKAMKIALIESVIKSAIRKRAITGKRITIDLYEEIVDCVATTLDELFDYPGNRRIAEDVVREVLLEKVDS